MSSDDKILLIIAGPNGSGKSSLITSSNLDVDISRIINPDNYARNIVDVHDIKERYLMAMKYCESLRNDLLNNGLSFGFETVASTEEKLEFVKKAKDKGYSINLLFVNAGSPEKCCERIKERVSMGGHDVPKEKVYSRYEKTLSRLHEYIDLADVAKIYDNSLDHLELILVKKSRVISVTDFGKRCQWAKEFILPFI